MDHYDQTLNTIYDAIDELNARSGPNEALGKTPGTMLIGPDSPLDSLGIVSLVTAVEEGVERQLNEQVNVMDIVAASESTSWDVETLARAIVQFISVHHA